MTEKKSFDELRNIKLEFENKYKGLKIFHIKSQAYYEVTAIHFKESDMSIEFSYEPLTDIVSFTRPINELTDGRFSF